MAVSGSYAYVADDDAGLRVIDVSTPASPTEVGFFDTPGNALDVAVSGTYAYVADRDAGLRVIDVSTPSNPIEVGFLEALEGLWRDHLRKRRLRDLRPRRSAGDRCERSSLASRGGAQRYSWRRTGRRQGR